MAAAMFVLAAITLGAQASAVFAAAPNFGTPVRLPTFKSCGGYEPGLALDKYGNIYVTAHKQNHCLAVADDPSAPIGVRAQSWLWTSKDGVTFKNMPGLANLPADPSSLDVGDEGDIALDDAGHPTFLLCRHQRSPTTASPAGPSLAWASIGHDPGHPPAGASDR